MRDPARILGVLAKIYVACQASPDLRLGQLIVNLSGSTDPFQIEDVILEERVDGLLASGVWPR